MADSRRSIPRPVLRWVPLGALVTVVAACVALIAQDGLLRVTGWYLLQLGPPLLGGLALLVTVLYAAIRRRVSAPVVLTIALALLCLWPVGWSFGLLRVPFPSSVEEVQPAATVRLPLLRPTRVLWGGDRLSANYHVFTPDQRWAYDLGVEPVLAGTARLEDYGCFGAEVIAPADAIVVRAYDGERDEVPGQLSNNTATPLGNHVVLRLEVGTFLVLAHLKKGSVLARDGEAVREGQVLAHCGNSGNTSEPHLHIHHQRQDPTKVPHGFAEGLPLYFAGQDGRAMPEGGFDVKDGRPTPLGPLLLPGE